MRFRMLALIAGMVVIGMAGCKSKETTSAILHNSVGRYDLAIKTANEALAKNPQDAEAHFQLGIAYSHLDSTRLSYEHFKTATKLDPSELRRKNVENNIQSNFAKHYNRALTLQKDDAKAASVEFKKATEANPTEPKGFFQLGNVYSMLGQDTPAYYDRAIQSFDRVLELSTPADKYYIDALKLAGQVLAISGKPEEAKSRFARLVEEDPTNYSVIEKIGYDRLNDQDWKGASVFLALAAEARSKIGAEDFNLFYNIGVAYFQIGKQEPEFLGKAIEYYQMALNLKPNEPTTLYNVMATYVVSEDWPKAAVWGERYVDARPDDKNGWRLLARAYSELGDDKKATQCMDRYEKLVKAK